MKNHETKMEQAMFGGWAISIVAVGGSLFFSEVMGFIPCELCWYQRILMYPLAVILGMAVVRKDYRQSLYGLVLSVIGACISLYHYLIQKVPALGELGKSCGIIPCNTDYINWFGFVTIPFLALIAFLAIAIVNGYVWKLAKGR